MEEGEIPASPENTIERWEYKNHFGAYLVRIAEEGRGSTEPSLHLPGKIELSPEWHEVHERMEMETRDGHERWTPIGYRRRFKDIHVPKKFLVGSKHNISLANIDEEFKSDLVGTGITHMIGDIHSHPGWGRKFFERFLRTGRIITEYRGFSPSDLFRVVDPEGVDFLIYGVVDSKANYYAFVTRETQRLPQGSKLSDSSEFQKYWFYEFTHKRLHKNVPISYPRTFSLWDVNLGIAQEYNIALYEGKTGQDLVRQYP